MTKYKLKDVFNLPNILTYFRLLCVPLFIIVFFSDLPYAIYWALGIFAIAEITDILDGKIARKLNMITDIGKLLDPLADKLLQLAAIICLTIYGNIHIVFNILLFVKEFILICGGIILVLNNVVVEANKWGKKASTILGYSMLSVFFHKEIMTYIKFPIDWVAIGVGLLFAYIALYKYLEDAYKKIKNKEIVIKDLDKIIKIDKTDDTNLDGE